MVFNEHPRRKKLVEICSPLRDIDPDMYHFCVAKGDLSVAENLNSELSNLGHELKDKVKSDWVLDMFFGELAEEVPLNMDYDEDEVYSILKETVWKYVEDFMDIEKLSFDERLEAFDDIMRSTETWEEVIEESADNAVEETIRKMIREIEGE